MQRLRDAMGQRENLYKLSGTIEMDEGYFTHTNAENRKLKRGRGSQTKKNVAVMAEATHKKFIETGKKSSHFIYAKMKALDNHTSKSLNEVVREGVKKESILITDKSTSYKDFKKLFDCNISYKSDKQTTNSTLKWVQITM